MIELYLSKVTENSETETAGKLYARVSYKQSMDLHDMAKGKKGGLLFGRLAENEYLCTDNSDII